MKRQASILSFVGFQTEKRLALTAESDSDEHSHRSDTRSQSSNVAHVAGVSVSIVTLVESSEPPEQGPIATEQKSGDSDA